jgi:hypothetical protein
LDRCKQSRLGDMEEPQLLPTSRAASCTQLPKWA